MPGTDTVFKRPKTDTVFTVPGTDTAMAYIPTSGGGGIPSDSILIEDGTGLFLEDGTYILLG